MSFTRFITALTVSVLLASSALAQPEDLSNLLLRDQHDTPVKLSKNIRYVLFAHDMTGKDLVDEWLESKQDDFLLQHHAVFVADISGMPRIIARLFAYPSLRKLPYQVLIDQVGERTKTWERQDSAVTLYTLDDYTITQRAFIKTQDELETAITEDRTQTDTSTATGSGE